MFLLEKTCHCLKSMSNDFSIHTYFDNELFFFKISIYIKFLFFCAYVTTMILWPFWLHSGAHGAFVPNSNCLLVINFEATSGHSIAISLPYSNSRSQQAPHTSSGYEIYVLQLIIVHYCAVLCIILCIIVHYCAFICDYCACKKQVNGPEIELC